ncbi:hypothetical protein FDG46_09275 [Clostridium botulinum]|uniref:Uncharacterized protein n=1 Tax=Clostridium botulinum (strain Hall / ATCC 3502 / NCTC 13319 / Type A) TaxID=441771 RepID=A5I0A3_CLOBH|nr:hypothetical protein DB732_05000 [Clostridium botulinum]CAL82464.1 hypothetical protein CBO0912 [Clostridium botulinum A str. ATCC 3502]EGT5614701.1 hypothetical protein [Clostridium botulinum]EGT5621854.1 hypothetical protein [Clostridium botulinum]EGT5624620.1 hypothetical protein [Clostridium botulinum]
MPFFYNGRDKTYLKSYISMPRIDFKIKCDWKILLLIIRLISY